MFKQVPRPTRQLAIIHLSDLHFGSKHRFDPPLTAGGDRPDDPAFPSLLAKLLEDLKEQDPGCPVLVCISGDLAETGAFSEFTKAESFIKGLAESPIFRSKRHLGAIFVVPGNHDLKFDSTDRGERWQQWADMHGRLFGTAVKREDAWGFVQLHDRAKDLGAVILCLNSAIFVQKDKPDEQRGRFDLKQLDFVEGQLKSFDSERLHSAIRIAVMHHHPVLIPQLAEPGRGYDAVHDSGRLLQILRRYGFHLILHGHKHNPITFTDDTRPAFQDTRHLPLMIVAGGSVGSRELPDSPRAANCYNQISVKWDPQGCQARIRVHTRGLVAHDPDGTEILPTRWTWTTLGIDDRDFYGADTVPGTRKFSERAFDTKADKKFERQRQREYKRTRGNLPVVEIRPALDPSQGYEAVLWIVPHPYGAPKPEDEIPVDVTWSAGRYFEVVRVQRADDPTFCARLTYWGPMLVQARLKFEDGTEVSAHLYARMPDIYSPQNFESTKSASGDAGRRMHRPASGRPSVRARRKEQR